MSWKDIYLAPGRLITWWQFMFPPPGQVWASGRRKDSPAIHFLFSTGVWAVVAFIGVSAVGSGIRGGSHQSPVLETSAAVSAESATPDLSNEGAIGSASPLNLTSEVASAEEPEAAAQAAGEGGASNRSYLSLATSPYSGVSPSSTAPLRIAAERALENSYGNSRAEWFSGNISGTIQADQNSGAPCRVVIYTVQDQTRQFASDPVTMCRNERNGWAVKADSVEGVNVAGRPSANVKAQLGGLY